MMVQINRTYQAKDVLLQKYLAKAKDLMKPLDSPEVRHVPREKNIKVDILSKLASAKLGGNN